MQPKDFTQLLTGFNIVFYSIIAGMALIQFAKSNFIANLLSGAKVDWWTPVLFSATFFFLGSDYVLYNYAVRKAPLLETIGVVRWFLNMAIFALEYLLVYVSTLQRRLSNALMLLSILTCWHVIVFTWYMLASFQDTMITIAYPHIIRAATYGLVGVAGAINGKGKKGIVARKGMNRLALGTCALIIYYNSSRLWCVLFNEGKTPFYLTIVDLVFCTCSAVIAVVVLNKRFQKKLELKNSGIEE